MGELPALVVLARPPRLAPVLPALLLRRAPPALLSLVLGFALSASFLAAILALLVLVLGFAFSACFLAAILALLVLHHRGWVVVVVALDRRSRRQLGSAWSRRRGAPLPWSILLFVLRCP